MAKMVCVGGRFFLHPFDSLETLKLLLFCLLYAFFLQGN